MTADQVRESISSSDLVKGVEDAFIDRLSQIAKVREVPAGELIVVENDATFDLMLLAQGEGKVMTVTDELLTTIKAGMPVGEISFFDRRPRAAGVVASTDSVVIVFPEEELKRIVNEDPASGLRCLYNLAGVLCARLRHANQQVAALLAVEESSLI